MSLRRPIVRTMNHLSVTYSRESDPDPDESLPLLTPSVSIDGMPLLEGFTLDLSELAASARCSGDFWIFVCVCGTPGCGGIERGVVVTHSGEQTRWLVPYPFRRSGSRSIRFREFIFDGRHYLAVVKAALDQVRTLAPAEGPYGASIDRLPETGELDVMTVREPQPTQFSRYRVDRRAA
jgi:hypothetical protein